MDLMLYIKFVKNKPSEKQAIIKKWGEIWEVQNILPFWYVEIYPFTWLFHDFNLCQLSYISVDKRIGSLSPRLKGNLSFESPGRGETLKEKGARMTEKKLD